MEAINILIIVLVVILLILVGFLLNVTSLASKLDNKNPIIGSGENNSQTQLSFEDICFPKEYKVQPQQKFVGDYITPENDNKALLAFHRLGGGKTCAAIQIAEKWIDHGKPLIVMPASLITGFRNELRTPCAGNKYISETDRMRLKTLIPSSPEYIKIIATSDAKIDEHYQIYSYNKFAQLNHRNLKAPIIIIDEVQNIFNEKGLFFQSALDWIEMNTDAPVVLLSGTPIFDSIKELNGLARLMRIKLPDDRSLTPADIEESFAGKVSYFAGAPKFTYPTTTLEITQVKASNFQKRWYKSEVAAEMTKNGRLISTDVSNDFYIKSRQCSNIVYPNGLKGDQGLKALTNNLIRDSLGVYSAKFAKLIPRLEKGELSFVYTGFTGAGGLDALTKCLRVFGWKDFETDGPGKKRYAIWSGDQTGKKKNIVRETFNSPLNDDGSQLQVVLGSPAIKEGVSLLRCRNVHILEAYWNHSRLEQIYGRADRYCSHKTLPENERNVKIYIYAMVTEIILKNTKPSPNTSIDLYMLKMADEKRKESNPFIDALINCAVDKY